MKRLFLIPLLLILSSNSGAQIPFITLLEKADYSSAGYYTGPVRTADGGYMTASSVKRDTAAFSITCDIVISKLDSFGVLQWSKLYEGDSATILAPERFMSDGSEFLLAVHRSSTVVPNSANLLLLKFDENGDTVWTKRFTSMVWCRGLFVRPDGNYILIGISKHGNNRAHQMVCLDSNGQIQWVKSYVPSLDCGGNPGSMMTADGGFIITGCGSVVTKFDSTGHFVWTTPHFEDDNGDDLQGWGIGEFPDGSLLLVGSIREAWSNPMRIKAIVMKLTSSGNVLWVKNILAWTQDTELFRAGLFSDGTMHLRGTIRDNPFTLPACDWIATIDTAGNILSSSKLCDPAGRSYFDVGSDFVESPFGGMVTFGLMRHSNTGQGFFSDVLASHGTSPAGCNILPGPTTVSTVTTVQQFVFNYANIDIAIPIGVVIPFNITSNVVSQTDFCLPVSDHIESPILSAFSLYPNPATDLLTILLQDNDSFIEIKDLSGKTVLQYESGTPESKINVSQLSRGIYLIRVTGSQGTEVKKVILH